jgi:hypothetical protein
MEARNSTNVIHPAVEALSPLGLSNPLTSEGKAISASATVMSKPPSRDRIALVSSHAAEIDSWRIDTLPPM